ncbi:ADPS [Symbiodinium sp. KB8]|nr:ADPS [Symbiodinium sp. KB8]
MASWFVLWLCWASAAGGEELEKFCDTEVYPPCDVGFPVGRDSPGLWTTNASGLAIKAARRPSRRFAASDDATKELGSPLTRRVHKEFSLPEALHVKEKTVIALHAGHDGSIAIGKGGRIQCVLELERLFEDRYFIPKLDHFHFHWHRALETVSERCECEDGSCPTNFDFGIMVNFGGDVSVQHADLPNIVERFFRVREWRNVNHHEAHALMGFFSSPFRSAFVLSYDGGGNDGVFNAFLGRGFELHRIGRKPLNLGAGYYKLASFLHEVNGYPETRNLVCERLEEEDGDWVELAMLFPIHVFVAFAGKLMGYSGLANPSPEIGPWIREYFHRWAIGEDRVPRAFLVKVCEGTESQRILAATIQAEFERVMRPIIQEYLQTLQMKGITVEGIVLTGGCALNVVANQLVRDTLTEVKASQPVLTRPRDVYVPPAPNDSGLTVGAIWAVSPPVGPRQPLQYLGFQLWDLEELGKEAEQRGAQRLSDLGGVHYLAELLAGGPAWKAQKRPGHDGKPIIAVVRGRQEFGPRALGHRSLLAVPDSEDMRDRMNRLKSRQWYRPVAPMIAEEALEEVFGFKYTSTYMEFAPAVRSEIRKRFPAIAHVDGTARHQSVSRADEPWVHALLLAVAKFTGLAALINTSFNSKGKPIVNTVEASLNMLDELQDLDYVLIEDWLFRAPAVKREEEVPKRKPFSVLALGDVTKDRIDMFIRDSRLQLPSRVLYLSGGRLLDLPEFKTQPGRMWTATEIWSLITASGDAFDIVSPVASGPARHTEVRPLWPDDASGKQPDNWSFVETRCFEGPSGHRKLWSFLEHELRVALAQRTEMDAKDALDLPPPPPRLLDSLRTAVDAEMVSLSSQARIRAGTGQSLADMWSLHTGTGLPRMPDAVVHPRSEDDVCALLKAAHGDNGFLVIPVAGGTNVTSSTSCPSREEESRPVVAVDMLEMKRMVWVKPEDGLACFEAGITGQALKDELLREGLTMGLEPECWERSTLGGWVASRATGLKQARYGDIEEVLVEIRVATSSGLLWQHGGHLKYQQSDPACPAKGGPISSCGRKSTGVELPGLLLGSQGCLGVITAAVIRVHAVPELTQGGSLAFPSWEQGARFARDVARLPKALRPASCWLVDAKQLEMAEALHHVDSVGRHSMQPLPSHQVAAEILLEGSREEVDAQKCMLHQLAATHVGTWGAAGKLLHQLSLTLPHVRQLGIGYDVFMDSIEILIPWASLEATISAVSEVASSGHRDLDFPGTPYISFGLGQLLAERAVLTVHLATSVAGLDPSSALPAFSRWRHSVEAAVPWPEVVCEGDEVFGQRGNPPGGLCTKAQAMAVVSEKANAADGEGSLWTEKRPVACWKLAVPIHFANVLVTGRFVVIAADGSLQHESGSQPLYSSSEGSAMSAAMVDVKVSSTASAQKLSSLGQLLLLAAALALVKCAVRLSSDRSSETKTAETDRS